MGIAYACREHGPHVGFFGVPALVRSQEYWVVLIDLLPERFEYLAPVAGDRLVDHILLERATDDRQRLDRVEMDEVGQEEPIGFGIIVDGVLQSIAKDLDRLIAQLGVLLADQLDRSAGVPAAILPARVILNILAQRLQRRLPSLAQHVRQFFAEPLAVDIKQRH